MLIQSFKGWQDKSCLKKWCSYTRQDFLEAVAPFIQNHRSGGGATVWR